MSLRPNLSAVRRLDFTPSKDGGDANSAQPRSRSQTRVTKVTGQMEKLRIPKRRHEETDLHVITEEEPQMKKEIKEEIIDIVSDDEEREDSGFQTQEDEEEIAVIFDNTNISLRNKRSYSYMGLFEANGGIAGGTLIGEFTRDFAQEHSDGAARRPLGCVFDERVQEFFLADSANDAIRVFRKNSTNGTAVYCDLRNPSALVATDPGRTCAVLDDTGIKLYDYEQEAFVNLVEFDRRDGQCRGLGLTSAGDLVTIRQHPTMPTILFYSIKKQNDLKKEVPYAMPQNPRDQRPRPSFLDIAPCGSNHDRMVITDLGLGTFAIYDIHPKKRDIQFLRQVDAHGFADDKFEFISGVKLDANCEMLVSDARGQSLKYLSKDGDFIQKIKFEKSSFPYVSNFCINSKNELLACDRRQGSIKLFQLKTKDKLDDYLNSL